MNPTVAHPPVERGGESTPKYARHCGVLGEPQENAEPRHLPKAADIYEGAPRERTARPTSASLHPLPPTHRQ